MEVYHSLSKEVILIESNHASKLHALIIGINAYPNLAKLKGAVADADAITHFLTSESQLKVPPNQIINLRNETATRRNIIDAIKSLQVNPSIDPGDPILIYYAGHGGQRNATDEWKEAKGAHQIQAIFPYDYDVRIDNSSDPIECIPDRTIAGLLNELSAAKGDSITVIFDSCHSPSGTRIPSMPKKGMLHRQERYAEVKRDIPWSIDSDIVNPELGIAPPPKDDEIRCTNLPFCVNQTSHVHLAACGSQEAAWEEGGRGVFTVALLKAIHANGVDKVTYQNLVRSLPILSSQSPHCYGEHKNRILFNAGFSSGSVAMIPVNFEEKTKKIVLQAGAISGIIVESIWEIYDSALENVLLGTFRAESPHTSTTELVPEETGGDSSYLAHMERAKSENSGTRTYARQVGAGVIGELRVHFTPAAKKRIFCTGGAEEEISYSIGSGVHDVGYVAHPTADGADIVVGHHSEREVSLRWCDRQAEHYGIATLEKRVYVGRIVVDEALFGAAKWKWHLERKNTDSRETTSLVTIELIRLGLKPGRVRMMYREQARRNMNIAGIADFEVRREDLYGVKLTSRANKPLYVRMFYFDISDFSISDLFGYQMDGTAIDPKGAFIIGDNAKGGPPLQFALNSYTQIELGHIKVFWSTEPLVLEELERKPAFNKVLGQWSRLRGADRDIDPSIEWGTALLTLVQRLPGVGK
ncbi:mycorrhiza-upregulated peptidase C14 [Rhizoctonia solani AG-3 Rhs1AP]|uniref:Mycorrhiza-upregulated peptidase C14 n=1 Tax=Rhizoctonia solani AG-3 Rhs1AP TaxID=1086054 RepID=X8JDT3_9AGAM|nr:mycorrhiza-upregulated peptidase C14 [Rhizoctonia solani AG-3 Rhs1AP]